MHDLIQQMAKDVICEEKTPGKRRWLWDPEEIYFLFTRETGTKAVRGIFLDMFKIGNINLSPTTFQKLYNLRYLHFYSSECVSAHFYAPQGIEYLPEGMRYLNWDRYPSKSLPLTSCLADNLKELVICNSQLEEMWNGVKNLPSLKNLDVSGSTKLIKVPDLSAASNLQDLHLGRCARLESLPDDICHLKSLQFLDVSDCGNLHRLPQDLGNLDSLVKLFTFGSGIEELPDSVCNLKACTFLHVDNCVNLHQLPQNFGNLQSLEHLRAGGSGMKEITSSINKLRELRQLALLGSEGLKPPSLTGSFPHRMAIGLTDFGMSELPVGLCSVTSLECLDLSGNHFESIPESIQHLLKLVSLSLYNCQELKYLPESLKSLPELWTRTNAPTL